MALDRHQVADQMRNDISTGKYLPGDRLPGRRELARQFGVAPNTVGEAVRLLAADGVVATKDKSGTIVLPPGERPSAEARLATAREELREVQSELRQTRTHLGTLEDRVANALTNLTGHAD